MAPDVYLRLVYLRLVHRLGWTAEDFQRWLEAMMAWRLLGTG